MRFHSKMLFSEQSFNDKFCKKNSVFVSNFSSVFATASYQSVRVWSLMKKQELLRIVVPNFSAAAVVFSFDGQNIITAWNDGVIRAFTPLTGKLIYAISNAHNKGKQKGELKLNCNLINSILRCRLFSTGHIKLRQFACVWWQ